MNKEEQQKFFNISFERNSEYLDLGAKFHNHLTDTARVLADFQTEINLKVRNQEAKL